MRQNELLPPRHRRLQRDARAKDDRGFAFAIKSGSVTTLFKYESDNDRILGIEMQSTRR